jgi:hypothetical protein
MLRESARSYPKLALSRVLNRVNLIFCIIVYLYGRNYSYYHYTASFPSEKPVEKAGKNLLSPVKNLRI